MDKCRHDIERPHCLACNVNKTTVNKSASVSVIKPCSKQDIESRLDCISNKVTIFDDYQNVDEVTEHYKLVDEYFELVKELRAL
jgi:hypothetical protein